MAYLYHKHIYRGHHFTVTINDEFDKDAKDLAVN